MKRNGENYRDFITGTAYILQGDRRREYDAIELSCPSCGFTWLQYASSEVYPEYCPGCGCSIINQPDPDAE